MVHSMMKNKEKDERTPFDDILDRVKEYADDPALATKETMLELLSELEEIKPFVDMYMETDDREGMDEVKTEDGKPSLSDRVKGEKR